MDLHHLVIIHAGHTTKKKEYITLSTLDVIGRLITHIQPKNFKMVRHYGIYSRNINKDLKVLLISLRIKATQKKGFPGKKKFITG